LRAAIRERLPRTAPVRSAGLGSLALIAALLIALPASALADADPASDVLLAQSAFFPYQPPVSHKLEATLEGVLSAAARAGLPLKVAVIESPEDLGGVPEFFGHPQQYAQFLESEISFNDHPPLLVVMPAGFGLAATGPPSALQGVTLDSQHSSYGLVASAILAAVALAHANGHQIATPAIPVYAAASRPSILLYTVPVVVLILAGFALARLKPRPRPLPDAHGDQAGSGSQ
jgi:hypothetical protein